MAGQENTMPFISNKINLFIRNFSKKEKVSNRILMADDIDFSINDQHWNLPGGKNEFIFKKLHFSAKNQFFELDSCTFLSRNAEDTNTLSISADKLYFNSSQLAALYEKEELIIDTLLLKHPVLRLYKKDKKNDATGSKTSVTDAIKNYSKE